MSFTIDQQAPGYWILADALDSDWLAEVDGVPTPRPRIAKSYELLAFLISCPSHEASREALLEVLFDGRSDDSAAQLEAFPALRAFLRRNYRYEATIEDLTLYRRRSPAF